MQRIAIYFFLTLTHFLFGQEIQITVIDSLNQTPISEVIVLGDEGQFISKSNNEGELWINPEYKSVTITANGYRQKQISLLKRESIICNLIKNSEQLKEVIIGKKHKLTQFGNTNLDNGMFTSRQLCIQKYNYLICATKIKVTNSIFLAFYNFCIYDKKNNLPFNFQIYNDKNGLPNEVVYSQYIKNYYKGWNRVNLENPNFILNPGVYYIAMQWIPLQDKSDVWISYKDKITTTYAVGQTLGRNKGDEKQLESFIYIDTWLSTNNNISKNNQFTHFIETY